MLFLFIETIFIIIKKYSLPTEYAQQKCNIVAVVEKITIFLCFAHFFKYDIKRLLKEINNIEIKVEDTTTDS